MKRGAIILMTGAAMLALPGCAQQAELAIRAKPGNLAPGEQPVSFRVAEARAHFALGNVALALEGFRKALREDAGSVDAMNGLAACYDRMGRFDLSRRYYEMALAVAPGDPRLYANLALSLDMQGKREEAASVRAEMASRLAAGQSASAALVEVAAVEAPVVAVAAPPVLGQHPVVAEAPALSVGPARIAVAAPVLAEPELEPRAEVKLAEAPQVAKRQPQTAAMPAPAPAAASVSVALAPVRPRAERPAGPRLERISLGEVALVSSGPVRWKPRLAERTTPTAFADRGSALRPAPVIRLTLLNAARSEGLAARTRTLLQRRGYAPQRIVIGNAPAVQRASVILYPTGRRSEAARLASQFGFALRHRPGTGTGLVVLLGRDAAAVLSRRRG
ncbi:LytR C-terminal domain-containing protein [Sphingomonas arenae]|uniref:LytR C-terminal domain-containing protein n=1 Tax=Sphingomonas arenae TaxID=2812555 RepID=UPI001967F4B3|nr:LytR C-terminal domain-containing protein [Sphingomonas arenae]